MSKLLRITTLVTMLFAALPAAQAATHGYNFSGTMDSGVHADSSFAGSFTFDDANGSPDWQDAVWHFVSSLSLTFLGTSYTLTNADVPAEVAFYNGDLLGLSVSFSSGDPKLTFVTATPGLDNPPYLAYDTILGNSGSGSVVYAPVPEPTSTSMLLAGLGLLGILASRRMRVC